MDPQTNNQAEAIYLSRGLHRMNTLQRQHCAILCPSHPRVEKLRLAPAHRGGELLCQAYSRCQSGRGLAQLSQQICLITAPSVRLMRHGPCCGAQCQHLLG